MRTSKHIVVAEPKGDVSHQIINKPRILHSISVWHGNTHSPVPYGSKPVRKTTISLCIVYSNRNELFWTKLKRNKCETSAANTLKYWHAVISMVDSINRRNNTSMLRAKSRNHWAKYVMAIDSAQYTMKYVLYYGLWNVCCVHTMGSTVELVFQSKKNATNYSAVHKYLLTIWFALFLSNCLR